MKNNQQIVTIYTSTDSFGDIIKWEGKLIDFGREKYAQYNNAPFVSFIPKGKRNGVKVRKTSHPYLLILPGVGHPQPQSMYVPVSADAICSVSRSRYLSFDERFKTDFDACIEAYCFANNITPLFDVRITKGASSY